VVVVLSGLTALHAAIIEGHTDAALYLIHNGASLKKQDRKGNLPLHYAVKNNQLQVIKALVSSGKFVMIHHFLIDCLVSLSWSTIFS